MKYSLRFLWYLTRLLLVGLALFALAMVVFFVAKDTANVYIIVSEGMQARAENILRNQTGGDLHTYFGADFIATDAALHSGTYSTVTVTDHIYHLDFRSIWCYPWQNTATVTVDEAVVSITVADQTEYDAQGNPTVYKPAAPQYPSGRYQLQLQKQDGKWRITALTLLETLPPEPTPTPEPGQTPAPQGGTVLVTAAPAGTPAP